MKSTSRLRNFLALAGSSLLAICSAHAQTVLADSYLTSLNVASPTTLSVTPNFPSFLSGPLTGSSNLTITGNYSSASVSAVTNPLTLFNNTGNTFSGNITIDSSSLRIAGNPFATSGGGFVAGSMTDSNTITINRAGTLHMDDNVSGGYTANRFGSVGDRPAVNLAGGTFNLNGLNNATSSVQSFGALTSSSGQGTLAVFRNSNGNPTLTFDSLAISSGSLLTFNGTNLGTGTADARITFGTGPTLTNGILAGARFYSGSPGTSELVTYGANGVTTFSAYDVSSNDINAATATQNVQIPLATSAVTLTGDVAVNSLNFAGNGPWSLGGNKLTITSGMFLRNGNNGDPTITNGTLTAGNGTDDIDLNIIVAQNNTTIQAVIADNAATAVTLVKSGDGRNLNLNGGANNTYTGGTYVVGGDLTTGNVASRTYLGTGKVTVDGNSFLNLQAIGATSNAIGDDFTATNGAKIQISNNNHGSVDTFNIAANSIIAGQSTSTTQGLASLTRGTNITLATGAIIAHNTGLTTTLDLATRTVQNLGTNADLYYGLGVDQNNASGAITIGSGTAFKGISTDRSARSWQQGIINIASGTTSVDFQGHATHGAAAVLTLGNGATAGNPVINFAGTGTVDINALGSLTLNDSTATYGNTGSNQNVRFVTKAGSTLTVTPATGMGSGTGIASALVNKGGSLAIGNTAALNGAVTVESGGRLVANQASGLTGTGTLTFNEGSIIDITNATGWSGAQATAASIAAGTIVRVGVNNPGTASETLDSFFGSKSPIYQLTGSDVDVPEPSSAGTTTLTLNKNGSGVGGILTNGLASTFFRNNVNGQVTIGANGGVIAATSNTELQVQETIVGTGVTLTIGTTAIIDGAPKLGSVAFGSAASSNTYTGETIINAGSLRTGYNDVLGATTNQITINTGGTLNVNGTSQTVGNLTGTGGAITLGNGTLIIGQGDNGGGNYQGSIQGSGGKLTKTGTGAITLSGANNYTGVTTVSAGSLIINGSTSTSVVTVASGATLGGTGTVGGTTNINGTLSPGQSPGTLTFATNLNINNGSTYLFEGGDLTDVAGILDLNDNWTLSLTGTEIGDGGSLVLFEYGTLAASPDLIPTFDLSGLGFTPSASLTLFNDTLNNQIVLQGVSVIPEPGAALLGSLGFLLIFRRRR